MKMSKEEENCCSNFPIFYSELRKGCRVCRREIERSTKNSTFSTVKNSFELFDHKFYHLNFNYFPVQSRSVFIVIWRRCIVRSIHKFINKFTLTVQSSTPPALTLVLINLIQHSIVCAFGAVGTFSFIVGGTVVSAITFIALVITYGAFTSRTFVDDHIGLAKSDCSIVVTFRAKTHYQRRRFVSVES